MRQLILLCALAGVSFAAQPLSIQTMLTAKEFASNLTPSIRPGGESIAFTVNQRRPGDNPGTRIAARFSTGIEPAAAEGVIYVAGLKTTRLEAITSASDRSWRPLWQPNGRLLLYGSDRGTGGQARLWLWNPETRSSRLLSDVILRGGYSWSSDSRFVLARVLPAGMTVKEYAALAGGEPPVATTPGGPATVFRSGQSSPAPPPFNLNIYLGDLVLIDSRSGAVRTVLSRKSIHWASFSPDGKYLLAVTATGFAAPGSNQILFDVTVLRLDSSAPVFRKTGVQLIGADHVSWSPDTTMLSYKTATEVGAWRLDGSTVAKTERAFGRGFDTDNRPPRWDATGRYLCFTVGSRSVHVLEIASGTPRRLADFENHWVELLSDTAGHVWSPPGEIRVTVAAHDNLSGRNSVVALALPDGNATTLLDTEENIGGLNVPYGFAVSPDRTHVAWFAENAQRPCDLWLADSSFTTPRRVTDLNPELSAIPFGPVKLLEWQGPDGQPLRGGLLLPPDYQPGKRYPMIVWVYGGVRQTRDTNRFGMNRVPNNNLQVFATRGYLVLMPDMPLRKGTPAADILNCVMPGVDRAIADGYADAARIGVMGNSYGGYSTLALITQTTRFRSAVASAPISNLVEQYLGLGSAGESYGIMAAEEGNLLLGATLWDVPSRYLENSPVFHLDKVRTPLLLLHGDQDTACRITHSEQVFVGLRRLGAEVELVRYTGEGHAILSAANRIDYWQRTIAWFDSHLRSQSE